MQLGSPGLQGLHSCVILAKHDRMRAEVLTARELDGASNTPTAVYYDSTCLSQLDPRRKFRCGYLYRVGLGQ